MPVVNGNQECCFFVSSTIFVAIKSLNATNKMSNKKVTMTDLRIIIREFARETPLREIERQCKLSRTSIRAYKQRAEASGKTMQELMNVSDAELLRILSKNDPHRCRDEERYAFMMDNVERYAQTMTRKYMTYDVLYEEYCHATDNPYGYTQFKSIIQEYERQHDYKYHNVYLPAREMQFDFAGDPLWVTDQKSGEHHKAFVLVVVLPYSMMSFAIAMLSTKMEFFFNALSKAVSYFGGVPEISKTDNMTQWVKRYDRYEPALNEAAQQWSLYYGTDMAGCRSRKPRDKGPAENLVNIVYKHYYSRIYNTVFYSISELNTRLMELNDQFNEEVRKGLTYSRRQKFEAEELPYLLPLPPKPYRFKYEKEISINGTYHFQIEKHFYSVPYQYVGQKAKVTYDAEDVEVWVNMERIASHKRVLSEGYTTIPEHMPEKHRAYAESKEYNAAYFIKKARQIGPHTTDVISTILESATFIQQSYRSCQGVLRLSSHYGQDRLENACALINPISAANYKRVRSILENKMDLHPVNENLANTSYMPYNDNVRGAEFYQ
jgi:transposase